VGGRQLVTSQLAHHQRRLSSIGAVLAVQIADLALPLVAALVVKRPLQKSQRAPRKVPCVDTRDGQLVHAVRNPALERTDRLDRRSAEVTTQHLVPAEDIMVHAQRMADPVVNDKHAPAAEQKRQLENFLGSRRYAHRVDSLVIFPHRRVVVAKLEHLTARVLPGARTAGAGPAPGH
jgi:hypothetical protein